MAEESGDQKPKLLMRIHPDDRDRVEGLNTLAKRFYGTPQSSAPVSYYTPILIQCTLPHSDPKTRDWVKTNGDVSLIISSGVDENLVPYGIPYGSFPRLVLAYIITRVIQTGERRIELEGHFSSFLREVGYTGNLRGNIRPAKSVRDQLLRLLRASVTFQAKGDGHLAVLDVKVAPKFELWWDFKNPEQDSLWGSYIQISEEFRQAILQAPVPLRADILKALKKSPLALDIYMWVSYRLFTMRVTRQESVSLSYGRLQEQFGTGIAEENYRQFRKEFKLAFAKVAQFWRSPDGNPQILYYDLDETRLTLYRSPLLIAKGKPSHAQEEAQRIFSSRRFDQETQRRARLMAGKWDVAYLMSQYFDWIEKEGLTPKDLRAHFLDFIKTHRQRHGETV